VRFSNELAALIEYSRKRLDTICCVISHLFLYCLLNRTETLKYRVSYKMLRTQGQYVFIHDVIKAKLESLGYGVTSPADDDDDADDADDDNDDGALYQSKLYLCCNKGRREGEYKGIVFRHP